MNFNKILNKIRILNVNKTRINFLKKLLIVKKMIIIINAIVVIRRNFNFINANFITYAQLKAIIKIFDRIFT